jgi:Zn-dependent M28 family amino/carboxypeptidase
MKQLGLFNKYLPYFIILSVFLYACGDNNAKKETQKSINPNTQVNTKKQVAVTKPQFSADSAYKFTQQQVAFGPRVPNTEAHEKTARFLAGKLKSFGIETMVQEGKMKAFNGKTLNIKNIIGSINPQAKHRIVLMAHWDSRPFADQDTKDRTKPIDGANDGAAGVGVLLEIARQLSVNPPKNLGVDFIFFDAEDYGQPAESMQQYQPDSWCLGSQYWALNPHKPGYTADYGILLDMIGAENALFTKESISMQYAPQVMNEVWSVAAQLGYQNHFINQQTQFVGTDDHYYVNKLAGIPTIDIIQYDPGTGAFGAYWHTHKDNMDIINKETLQAVGETVLAFIYKKDKEI